MPSWTVTLTIVLLASIGFLTWVLVRSQRQYQPLEGGGGSLESPPARRPPGGRLGLVAARPGPAVTRRTSGPLDPVTEALEARMAARVLATADRESIPEPGGLAHVAATAVAAAARLAPRNSAEARAVESLRTAMAQALQGQFDTDVRAAIDAIDGIQVWHDIRRLAVGGLTIAHLAVAPRGVYVIDPAVRTAKLSVDEHDVYTGRGDERTVDPMLDEVLEKVAAVAGLVEPAPVLGVIVLEDRLTLPHEIRSGGMKVRGVQLTTVSQLPERLLTGLPLAAALDVDAIWARLFAAFVPAVDTPDHPFAAPADQPGPSPAARPVAPEPGAPATPTVAQAPTFGS
ncbi:MAG: hypothetical protein R2761_24125 [Acidimicrobiales bacterium]